MGKLNDFLIELAHIASTLDRIERNTRIQDRKRWSEQLPRFRPKGVGAHSKAGRKEPSGKGRPPYHPSPHTLGVGENLRT